ncbi:ROK family transcriptional regulator [Micromonospora sp. HM5-17]|uniref:ROK family transcriptional regulator n=1 Tax=Micromonospora sp. HM5-17 TaxID=2487710 RepID=UPI001F3DB2B8|nr:ROK family transcriptional regulator [Micromonospora sp. HM5-17]
MARPSPAPVGTAAATAVRQASLREHNLALVLRHVATAPRPPSRAELAATTGLTRATVSTLVDELITGRLLTEVDPTPRSGAGRPALGLALAGDGPVGLGLEINVDYLAACLVDPTGAVRHHAVRRIDLRPVPPAEALAMVAELITEADAEAARQDLRLAGTALAVPGLVTADGVVRLAPNLGWRDVDVPALLGAHPVLAETGLMVDNEANLAALGELRAGAPDPATFIYISGEVGIGAGIVLHGSLFRGARGWSGELGHVPVHPEGRPCRCGGRGCLEQYAGQEAILASAGLAGSPVARLVEAAERADPVACQALTEAAGALGVAVAGVINLLDVDTVVLGGVYAPLARWLAPPIEAEIRRRVLTAAWSPVTVRAALLGGDAAALGAAGSVVRTVLEHPARWLTTPVAGGRDRGRAGGGRPRSGG